MSAFSLDRIILRKLTLADDTGFFDCGDAPLNEYIRFQAKDQQLEGAAAVYLATFENQIVGFLSLSMSSIKVSNIGRRHRPLRTPYRYYPALMIGRLAVEQKFQGKRIGRKLCLYAIATAAKLREEAGCQFVVLNAKKPSIEFYERCGFKLAQNQPTGRREPFMYFKIPTNN